MAACWNWRTVSDSLRLERLLTICRWARNRYRPVLSVNAKSAATLLRPCVMVASTSFLLSLVRRNRSWDSGATGSPVTSRARKYAANSRSAVIKG